MKTPLIPLAVLFFTFSVPASVPIFSIGTNQFSFVFQDDTLSMENKEIIANDLVSLITSAWTNAPVEFSGTNEGNILFSSLGEPPFSKLRPLPSHFSSADTNGVRLLVVEKSLSNDYLGAISLQSPYTQQILAVQTWVDFLNSEAFPLLPQESVSQYFYMDGLDEAGYRASRTSWIDEADGTSFIKPCILSYEVVQDMIDGEERSLTAQIPIQKRTSNGQIKNSSVPAVWIDGRWKIYVISW